MRGGGVDVKIGYDVSALARALAQAAAEEVILCLYIVRLIYYICI